jgi:hypothetical protein
MTRERQLMSILARFMEDNNCPTYQDIPNVREDEYPLAFLSLFTSKLEINDLIDILDEFENEAEAQLRDLPFHDHVQCPYDHERPTQRPLSRKDERQRLIRVGRRTFIPEPQYKWDIDTGDLPSWFWALKDFN